MNIASLFAAISLVVGLQQPAEPSMECAKSFEQVLARTLKSIEQRDLASFMSTLAPGDGRLMILPDGTVWDSHSEVEQGHREWFADPSWTYHHKLVHQEIWDTFAIVAFEAEVKRPQRQSSPFLLSMVFALSDDCWHLVHDQNTPLPAPRTQ